MSDRSRGLDAEAHIPHQTPFAIHAHLLAFNGRTAAGRTAIWVHAYAADPPDLPGPAVHRPSGHALLPDRSRSARHGSPML